MTARAELDEATAVCLFCGCDQAHACPGGCGWNPGEWAHGRAICTACTRAPFTAEPVQTIVDGDIVPDPSGRWQLFMRQVDRRGGPQVTLLFGGPKDYVLALREAMNAAHASAIQAFA